MLQVLRKATTDFCKMRDKATSTRAPSPSNHRLLSDSTTCYLLQLPPELRNAIYQSVIVGHGDRTTAFTYVANATTHRRAPNGPRQPPLSRTCKRIRHEVLAMFYGQRTFNAHPTLTGSTEVLQRWCDRMRPSLWFLRSLTFQLWTKDSTTAIPMHVFYIESGALRFLVDQSDMCTCRFYRCLRDVERSILGSNAYPSLIRFMEAWDVPPPPAGFAERSLYCGNCGKRNTHLSLRKHGEDEAEQQEDEELNAQRSAVGIQNAFSVLSRWTGRSRKPLW
jgi:hypothetical protein